MGGKQHRTKKAGSKAKKKKENRKKKLEHQQKDDVPRVGGSSGKGKGGEKKVLSKEQQRINNPKAFGVKSSLRARQSRARKADKEQKRLHAPILDKTPEEPPPMVVLVHGPPGCGKSTVIRSLVKHYARQNISDTKGPISVISGKNRRITLIECPKDLNGMIDASKVADLVLLVIDGNFGFEMETFEFLNLLQVHGFPKVMGVLTHLDLYKNKDRLKKVKKGLKARFWNEIYQGAKLFYFSGLLNGRYPKREVLNLARFISVQKVRPLSWRNQHPYIVADRLEDITPPEIIHSDPKCDRDLCMYGYVRGSNLRIQSRMHIAGAGDYDIGEVSQLPDPCPLPEKGHKKSLSDKSRLIYAPMANLGNLMYDKDATYIDIPDWKVQFTGANVKGNDAAGSGEQMVLGLQQTDQTVDEKLSQSTIQLFAGGKDVNAGDMEEDTDEDDSSGDDSSRYSDSDDDSDDDSDGSSDDESDEEEGNGGGKKDGRVRRRAVFDQDGLIVVGGKKSSKAAFESDSEGSDDSDDDDKERAQRSLSIPKESGAQWKERMGQNIATIFSTRASDIMNLVYGNASNNEGFGSDLEDNEENSEEEDDLDFFKPVGAQAKVSTSYESDDCSKSKINLEEEKWTRVDEFESLRNWFVTGDW
jgi:ribosome biogenesis protein BMS1